MSNFEKVINRYRNQSHSEADKGKRFERLMQAMLLTIPPYCNELQQVWTWSVFPYRLSISAHDAGIDLVAQTNDGRYWAIQCKCYLADAKIDKSDTDTFLTSSARAFTDDEGKQHYFAFRLWIDTTEGGFTTTAAESFKGQMIPAAILHLNELAEMPVDWEELDKGITGQKAVTKKKEVMKHQQNAIDDALNYFKDHDRGKLIMACGTGKTFTSLRIAEALAAANKNTLRNQKVLFLVPSIALLGQTLREWSLDAQKPIRPLCICSDSEVSRTHSKDDDTNITTVEELAFPASTSVEQIKHNFLALQQDKRKGMLVVFSTYQSIERIAAAQRAVGDNLTFDLIICDEAHRTTGVTLKGDDESAFVRVHDNNFIHGRKRMYMTATPRLYKDEDQKRAREKEAYLCSMDDEGLYGDEFHRLDFSVAVKKDLLSDYKVLILNVEPEDVSNEVRVALSGLDDATRKEVDTDDMAKLIGVINALSKRSRYDNRLLREIDPQPMHRAVAFCQNIRTSKAIATAFNACQDAYFNSLSNDERQGLVRVEADHVDGSMGAATREAKLGWLKHTRTDGLDCHLLSNVRCLSEGVDVPSLDAVIFLSPKNSQVDVVQSVGRVMRRAGGKKYGYIIIPIVVPSNIDPEEALDDNKRYAVVWDILRALRSHDDGFNATVNKIELNKSRPDSIQLIRPGSKLIGQGGGISDDVSDGDGLTAAEPTAAYQTQLEMRFEQLQNLIFARMVQKVGSKRYWEQWASDVAKVAERHIEQINHLIADDSKARTAFDRFLRGLHRDINPSVSEAQAVEMLAQHIITQPVFEALFDSYAFTANNPVSKAMSRIVAVLNEKIDEKDHKSLEKFYDSVQERAKGIDNAESKQKIVVELYDKFFTTAFPKVKEQLGIVYTPVEVVDFIIHSVEHVLKEHFGRSLNDRGVKIIDPFTGTGTFITRLLQSGIIRDLEYKYQHEIFANEIVLLAYYIASVNIENVYHDLLQQTDSYTAFPGICLTDTFQLGEQMYAKQSGHTRQKEMEGLETPFVENSKRVQKQLDSPITVIIGNPPYSIGQKSANDNAQNQHYPLLESHIQNTYNELSEAHTKNAMFDSYIKAFRYATDRLDDYGIIAFVSNGSWLDTNAADGFRKSIEQEFAEIYVFNLRGNQRTSGELSRREGGKIFGSGSRTPVSITLLVKKPHEGKAVIHYHDIGDYLSREQKLDIIRKSHSIATLQMDTLHPNKQGDWINHRNDSFNGYPPIGDKENKQGNAFFESIYARGLGTSRDVWVYNSSKQALQKTIERMVNAYNDQRERLNNGAIDDVIYDSNDISWNASLIKDARSNKKCNIEDGFFVVGAYRPFNAQNLFFLPQILNESVGAMQRYFPKKQSNYAICVSCAGSSKRLTSIVVNNIPDLHFAGDTQCFPLYWYEENKSAQGNLFDDNKNRYIRHDAITDFILKRAREQYGPKVTKEDIFYYVYGFLHCPSYRETFANDLKKMLPRLPLVEKAEDFWAFSRAGRKLAELHLNYEQVPPSKEVVVDWHNMLPGLVDNDTPEKLYRVEQMRFGRKVSVGGKGGKEKDRSIIEYNQFITLRNIPLRAYDYVVNGKSAIEWIMERYCDKVDKKSGIRNDANQWGIEHGNPKYPLELLQSIITLSLKTLDIVDSLPKVTFE
ncbi:MAG: DEAD/DEAH box helicase [Bacteroidales bacterium]|nr:DEAD/DEAH box helicase [Bacteroidales bacterium]